MKLQLDQSHYWNTVGDQKQFNHHLNPTWLHRHLPTNAHILDYGCGYGRSIGQLKAAGYFHLTGMDNAQTMIELAQQHHPDTAFIHNNSSSIPLPDQSVEAIILMAVLTCIPFNADQHDLIKELSRILKKGGVLYISDLLISSEERNKIRYDQARSKYETYGIFEVPDGAVLRHHDRDYLMQDLLAKFVTLEEETFTAHTMNGNTASGYQWMGKID